MAKDDVTLTIGVDASSAKKSFDKLKGTLIAVAGTVATVFAGKAVIDAATQQEKAINALNQSLIRTGDYSEEASQDLQDFASELQSVTTIGDEATLELLALAKSFGVTNEEAKKMVTTAADASVALGVDARTALEQLGGTLSGVSGRLAKFVPEVKELSQEALKSGEAIDIFAERFAGAASGELQTFDGALTQTKNIFGDLLEEVGFFITQSPAVISAVKGIGQVFASAIEFLKDNQGAIRQGVGGAVEFLIKGFGFLAKNILPPVIEAFLLQIKVMQSLKNAVYDTLQTFLGFDFVSKTINTVYQAVLFLADAVIGNLLVAFQTLGDFVGVEIPNIEKALQGVRDKIIDIADVDAASGLSGFIDKAQDVQDAVIGVVEETLKSIQDGANTIDFDKLASEISEGLKGKININPVGDTSSIEQSFADLAKKFGSNVVESVELNIVAAAKALAKNFLNIIQKGTQQQRQSQEVIETLKLELENASSLEERRDIEKKINEAQEAQIKAQEDAAYALTGELGAFIGDTFLPGAGQFVKLFLDLAKDPESFRAFIEGFVESLPEIIDAIVDSLPIIVEVLAENFDKILIAVVVGLVKIIGAIVESLGVALSVLFRNIGRELETSVADAGQAFIDSIVDGAQSLIDSLNDFFKSLDITSGGGGGTLGKLFSGDAKGFAEDIGGAFGFADGGIVPPGFPNDSGIAKVTSGEMVLNDRQQQNLFNLLDNGGFAGGGQQMITVNLVMNEEVLASQILEINRDNLRTA